MTPEEAIVVAAAKTKEDIEDKDKSSHRLIGGKHKDEGSGSVSSGSSNEILTTSPARF